MLPEMLRSKESTDAKIHCHNTKYADKDSKKRQCRSKFMRPDLKKPGEQTSK